MTDRVVRRLTLLQNEAQQVPVPTRKFFHIGQPQVMDDVGECVPMISWVADNLSRFVVTDTPSDSWGRGTPTLLLTLPNLSVEPKDGVLLATGRGNVESLPHPSGKGRMHFVYLNREERLFTGGIRKLYIYRLDGVQVKGMASTPEG